MACSNATASPAPPELVEGGDAINAILVGAGHNIRLLLAWLRALLRLLLVLAAAAIRADFSQETALPTLA